MEKGGGDINKAKDLNNVIQPHSKSTSLCKHIKIHFTPDRSRNNFIFVKSIEGEELTKSMCFDFFQ